MGEIFFDPDSAVNAKPGFVGLTYAQDDDNAPVVSINDVSVVEGDSGVVQAVFTVSLSNPSVNTVDFFWVTSNGTAYAIWDYAYAGGGPWFNPGVTSITISVPVYGDLENEADETFSVILSTPATRRSATARRLPSSATTSRRWPTPAPTRRPGALFRRLRRRLVGRWRHSGSSGTSATARGRRGPDPPTSTTAPTPSA
jgi:hypothetical protein